MTGKIPEGYLYIRGVLMGNKSLKRRDASPASVPANKEKEERYLHSGMNPLREMGIP